MPGVKTHFNINFVYTAKWYVQDGEEFGSQK